MALRIRVGRTILRQRCQAPESAFCGVAMFLRSPGASSIPRDEGEDTRVPQPAQEYRSRWECETCVSLPDVASNALKAWRYPAGNPLGTQSDNSLPRPNVGHQDWPEASKASSLAAARRWDRQRLPTLARAAISLTPVPGHVAVGDRDSWRVPCWLADRGRARESRLDHRGQSVTSSSCNRSPTTTSCR